MKKTKRLVAAALALCVIMGLCIDAPAQQKTRASKRTAPGAKPEKKSMPDQMIACNLFGLTEQQRRRQQELRELLFDRGQQVRELPDGYAVGLPATAENILAAAEFVTLERLCCSFFRFEIAVGGESEPLWLRLTGGKDVKEFLKSELLRRK